MRAAIPGPPGREAAAVVADRDGQAIALRAKVDRHPTRARMLAHVGERLRDDPECLRLHVRIEPRRLDLGRCVDADRELRGLGDARGVGPDCRDQTGRRPDRAAQAEDRLPDGRRHVVRRQRGGHQHVPPRFDEHRRHRPK